MWCRRKYCCNCRYSNEYEEINTDKLKIMQNENDKLIIVDVRSPQEYAEGHIPGSICIPNYEILKKARTILPDKNLPIVVYCENGIRSRKAANLLKQIGYKNIYNLNFS